MTALTTFASAGQPCEACGAPLAADQRYCVACGARRAPLPFLEILRENEPGTQLVARRSAAAAVAGGPPLVADGSLAARARASTGIIAGVGVLLLAMLIGVLVGSGLGRNEPSVAAAAPPSVIVTVGGTAAPAAASTASTPTVPAAPADAPTTSTEGAATTPPTAKSPIKTKAVSTQKLKSLSKLSGKEYQKQIDKLGKNIATGGKAPPKDTKPAAGGGAFEEIG